MDDKERQHVARALRAAAQALMARGPTNPQAVYRYGSKPNQAPVMKYVREFLETYAAAGNKLMQGEHPGEHTERLQNLATRIGMDLDELVGSLDELSKPFVKGSALSAMPWDRDLPRLDTLRKRLEHLQRARATAERTDPAEANELGAEIDEVLREMEEVIALLRRGNR
jgi:hypothetical protein